MQWNIDTVIFTGFLLINLVVGLFYGRGVKTISDYALGGRNFSTAALVATIVATFMDGSGFFVALSKTYSQGLIYVVANLTIALQLLIVATFIIPRMGEFMGALSVAEVMGNLYGRKIRVITAVCGILFNIGIIAVQFKVFGSLMNYFVGFSQNWGIIIAATIVILYSAFGGIKAVTYTDVLQFFTFGFIIPLIGIIIWNQFQTMDLSINSAVHNPLFNYNQLLNLQGKELFSFICLTFYFLFPTLYPTDFQRISMGRNVHQAKTATIISMTLFLVISLAIMWIPFLIININPAIPSDKITNYIINNYTDTGIKGLMIVGVTAMAMSTADSFINVSAVLFAHDLKEVFKIKVNNLTLSKLFSLILGICAIYLALSTNDLLDMVMTGASFYMPVVAAPLLLSILGFRSSNDSVLLSMIAGFTTVIILMLWKIDQVILPAVSINILFLFGYHYLAKQPGGWVGIKDRTYPEDIKNERKRKIVSMIKTFKSSGFIEFCKKTAPKDEMMYTWLGIYFIFLTISTMYSTQVALLRENGKIILTIYKIMMCTGTAIAMYPIWPPRIKRDIIMQVAWNIVIFYMLVFLSCFFVMLSDFGQLQFAIFTMNIIITAILVGWKLSLVMIVTGFYSSVQFYKYYAGIDKLNISIGSPQFIFIYTLMLVGGALIIFLKPKQEREALIEGKNEHLTHRIEDSDKELAIALGLKNEFISNINHEYNAPMTCIKSMVQILRDHYDKFDDPVRKQAIDGIYESSLRLERFDNNLAILSKLNQQSCKLSPQSFNLSELLYDRIEICKKLYASDNSESEVEFILNIEKNVISNGDRDYLTKTLDNLIINAIRYCTKGKINITLWRDNNNIEFTISDEGIGIPRSELWDIFEPFVTSSKSYSPAGGRGIGLAVCKKVITVHGGEIRAESDGIKGATFSFWIPSNYTP